MPEALSWINANWLIMVGIFFILDKVTKITPWKGDDFIVDVIYGGIKKALGKK